MNLIRRTIRGTWAKTKNRVEWPWSSGSWRTGLLVILGIAIHSVATAAAEEEPPDVGKTARALVAPVIGTFTAPPRQIGSKRFADGPVLGNGDLGVVAGGPPESLSFYFGKADFFGVLKGGVAPVGSLNLRIPELANATYLMQQNVGPATLTGIFGKEDGAKLGLTSWVCSGTNLFVLQLQNQGTKELSISSRLLDGLGTPGNGATLGSSADATWLRVSPDILNLELGNRLLGRDLPPERSSPPETPFKGEIADFRIYRTSLSPKDVFVSNASAALQPSFQWTSATVGQLQGTARVDATAAHGGSIVLDGNPAGELWAGALRLPQSAFTLSVWIRADEMAPGRSCLAAACLNLGNNRSHGVCLSLLGGKPTITLNRVSVSAPEAIPLHQWVCLCANYDGTTMNLYVDGKSAGSTQAFPPASVVMGIDRFSVHFGDPSLPFRGCGPDGLMVQRLAQGQASVVDGALQFHLEPGAQATLLLSAVTDRNNADFEAEARRLARASMAEVSRLQAAHSDWWQDFWSKSYVQIADRQIQDNWYASLYLLACCSKGDCDPPGLWGNFVTAPDPYWNGDYTLNYNYEAPFWAAYLTNHLELTDNYETPLLGYLARGRAIAQGQKVPQKGLLYYMHLIPEPGWSNDGAGFLNQKCETLFACVDCVMRWRLTHDLVYARKVYPFLLGTADFWDNYLVLRDGRYVDLDDGGGENKQNDNPSTSLAFLRLLYPTLIEISHILNLNQDRTDRWEDILKRLSPLPIVPAATIDHLETSLDPQAMPPPKGQRRKDDYSITLAQLLGAEVVKDREVIRNGETGWGFPFPMVNLYHDHRQRQSGPGMSSSQCLFPGWAIGLESSTAQRKAALDTVTLTAHWYDFNNMSTFYAAAACAGYDPKEILDNLHELIVRTSYPSFIIPAGGGGTENFAITPAALSSMFLQSYQASIHLFPDWPINEDAAFANFNACGAFLLSSRLQKGSVQYIGVESLAGEECRVVNPWEGKKARLRSNLDVARTLAGDVLNFTTQKGEKIVLTPAP